MRLTSVRFDVIYDVFGCRLVETFRAERAQFFLEASPTCVLVFTGDFGFMLELYHGIEFACLLTKNEKTRHGAMFVCLVFFFALCPWRIGSQVHCITGASAAYFKVRNELGALYAKRGFEGVLPLPRQREAKEALRSVG